LIFTFLLPLFSNIAIRMFSLKTRYTHCLIWYIQMYVKFPGKLVTCIFCENDVYRTKSDR
jgi:hypothetical protein